MKTKNLLFLACATLFAASYLTAPRLSAQALEILPVPAPTPGSPPSEEGPGAKVTMDDGSGATFRIRGPNSPRVRLRAGQRTTVVLQYDPSYAGLALEVAVLDAGNIRFPGNRNFVAPNGTVILQFSDAREPGLYRLLLNCGGTASTLQFWVPDPDEPGADASLVVPQALLSAAPPASSSE